MSTVAEIRAALKTTLKNGVPSLNVYSTVEDVIETPAAVIGIRPGNALHPSANFEGAMARGLDEWHFEVNVFTSRREGGYAQSELDQYLTGSGAKSIRQVLFQNPSLGLDDTDAQVTSMMNYGAEHQYMKVPHVGATLNVCVRTDGS